MSNIWYNISPGHIQPGDFAAVIGIPKDSKKKYELNRETGLIILNQVLHISTHYSANYGFILRIYGDNSDPLDMLVLCPEGIDSLTLMCYYPIGYISMLDGGRNDEKVIVIPFSDSTYNPYHDLMDLPPHLLGEMKYFFSVHKASEGRQAVAKDVNDRAAAVRIIRRAMDHYAEYSLGGSSTKVGLYPAESDQPTTLKGRGR